MGRYAQRRLRGGTPLPPTPPPGVQILSITPGILGNDGLVTFDQVVNFFTGPPPDGALLVNGQAVQSLGLAPPSPGTQCTVLISGTISIGDPWALSSQPGWLVEAAGTPQSGLVT